MLEINVDLTVPVLVTLEQDGCSIYVPDLNITAHGEDYIGAMANTIMASSAIYYYNLERNIKFEFKTTYAQVQDMCKGKNQFATFASLTK